MALDALFGIVLLFCCTLVPTKYKEENVDFSCKSLSIALRNVVFAPKKIVMEIISGVRKSYI